MPGDRDIFDDPYELPQADHDLARVFGEIGVPVDRLAYSPEFDELYELYGRFGHPPLSKTEVFRRLLLLSKAGQLPRLFGVTVPA